MSTNNIELQRACAKLSVMIALNKEPVKRDYSKEWAQLKNKNYMKGGKK